MGKKAQSAQKKEWDVQEKEISHKFRVIPLPTSKKDEAASLPNTFPPFSEFKVRWPVLIVHTLMHAGSVWALWHFSLNGLVAGFALYFVTMLGITAGYHRQLAHRSYDSVKVVTWFHAALASISLQLGPITWARMHRAHHVKSDTLEDPHPQIYGFWFGHMGWLLLSHPSIGRSELWRKEPKDLTKDPVLVFLEKFNFPIFLLSMVALYYFGGLSLFLWAGCLRVTLTSHLVWFVNSIAHRFGTRRFETEDLSRNNFLVALTTLGEGWHNNHHRFPGSARQGLFLYEFDFTWLWLNFLKRLGLVWNLKTPASYAPPPTAPLF